MGKRTPLNVTGDERAELERLVRQPSTPAVKRWLARRPEYHLHFTPTSANWLNQVERVFADLTAKHSTTVCSAA